MELPTGPLTQAQVEALWAQDAVALLQCGLAKEALETYYNTRDQALLNAE